jgi:hypothetical protein
MTLSSNVETGSKGTVIRDFYSNTLWATGLRDFK